MKLHTIHTGYFKLDGGAMFGVVPKSIWNKINPADDTNMCSWAMRCLLVQTESRCILIDTGIGDKQSPDFFRHYYLHGSGSLRSSLAELQIAPSQITDVILTHLHFDHVGGAVYRDKDSLKLTFPQANYWVHSEQLHNALYPNAREKASFLKENIQPIVESKQLCFLDTHDTHAAFEGKVDFIFVDGHTEKQALPLISTGKHTILYCADLVPSVGHIQIPYIMSYDMQPLKTLDEKNSILTRALDENWYLFFEHDPTYELCSLQRTEKGIRVLDLFALRDIV